MQIRRLARWVGGAALIVGLAACVVHDTQPVNPGYGYYGPQTYGPQNYGPAYGPDYAGPRPPGVPEEPAPE